MADKINLPSSSYKELVKIIRAYSNLDGHASLDDIAKLTGINRTTVSKNSKFLVESGLTTSGNKKAKTELGEKLGRALDHDQKDDIQSCWRGVVSASKAIADLVTTVRIKSGMTVEELVAHTLYVSGQKKTKANQAGANAIIEILKVSGLLISEDGKLIVSQPNDGETEHPAREGTTSQPSTVSPTTKKANESPPESTQQNHQISPSIPQIAINIQLHLPETNEPEVYQNLFKALKENLFVQGE